MREEHCIKKCDTKDKFTVEKCCNPYPARLPAGSKRTRKNGTGNGKQRYRYQDCDKQFDGGNRLNAENLWQLYSQGKQTTEQLAQRYGRSRKTISRYLQKVQTKSDLAVVQNANILMDTTYFNRQYDVMVLYDSISKQGFFGWCPEKYAVQT